MSENKNNFEGSEYMSEQENKVMEVQTAEGVVGDPLKKLQDEKMNSDISEIAEKKSTSRTKKSSQITGKPLSKNQPLSSVQSQVERDDMTGGKLDFDDGGVNAEDINMPKNVDESNIKPPHPAHMSFPQDVETIKEEREHFEKHMNVTDKLKSMLHHETEDVKERKRQLKERKRQLKEEHKAHKRALRDQKLAEKARIKAQKQIDKEERKAEKAKLAGVKLSKEEKLARKEELKAQKLLEKAEKQAIRDQKRAKRVELKESKKAYKEKVRLAKINSNAYLKQKEQRRQEKKQEKLAVKMAKEQYREQKKAEKQRIRDERARAKGRSGGGSHGKGFKVATLVLAIVTLSLTLLSGGLIATTMSFKHDVDNAYNKAYYQFVDDLNKMETTLSKSMISNDEGAVIQSMNEVSALALSAENNFTSMPSKNEAGYQIVKYFNQVMDYSKSLVNKLVDGEKLTQEDKDNIKQIYEVNVAIKSEINKCYDEKIKSGRMFANSNIINGEIASDFDGLYTQISEESLKMPALIYDGPFSDSKEEAEMTEGKVEISQNESEQIAKSIFKNKGEIKYRGEVKTKGMHLYSYSAMDEEREFDLDIDVNSGLPVLLTAYRKVESNNIEIEKAKDIAEKALEYLGYDDVEGVWEIEKDNVVTFNFAYEDDDVIFYSRLVKVKVALDNGEVLGVEGNNYAKNKEQVNIEPKLSMGEARGKVSRDLDISSSRLTVIPMGMESVLAYEFAGKYEGLDFFVYIDAQTGKQIKIMRVVDNEQGRMLI